MYQSYIEWKKYAPYHDPDIEEFYSIIDNIEKNKKFTIIRLADGEYSCLIDNQSLQDLLDKNIIEMYSNILKKIINLKFSHKNKNLLLGLEMHTYSFNKYKQHLTPLISKIDTIYSSSIFSHASVTYKLYKLSNALFKKNVLLIGPQYLSQIYRYSYNYNQNICKFKFTHIITPIEKVWEHQQEIEDKIENYINKNHDLIIIYACSITAKIAALKFYEKYKNKITQIDIGAALDPYAKKISRPWHEFLIQEIYK